MRLYANPYDRDAEGFYFEDLDDYEQKYEDHLPVEEYEIDFISGTPQEAALFNSANVDQSFLEKWFDFIEEGETHLWPAVYYYLGVGYDLDDAIRKAEDNSAVEGTAKEAVEQWIDDMGGPEQLGKETLEQYFDYDQYAHDMELNGEANEFDFAGETFTIIGSD